MIVGRGSERIDSRGSIHPLHLDILLLVPVVLAVGVVGLVKREVDFSSFGRKFLDGAFPALGDEVDETDGVLEEAGPSLGKRLEAGGGDAQRTCDGGLGGVLLGRAEEQVEREDHHVQVRGAQQAINSLHPPTINQVSQ